MKWLFLFLVFPAYAQQIIPLHDFYCGAMSSGVPLLSLRVSLLEGKEIRKYRDVDLKALKLGDNTITFTKVVSPIRVNGMRIDCEFQLPGEKADQPTGRRWDVRVYNLPAGSVPTVVMELVPKDGGGGWLIVRGRETL